MLTSPPSRTSPTLRFSGLLLLGFRRRSMMCMAYPASGSAGLLDAHVPIDEPAYLALGVAARRHPLDELLVFLLGLAVLLRPERDDREQILDLRKHSLLDYLADLLITDPGRIPTAVVRSRSQGEFDYLVAEILGIGDSGRLLYLGELLVEKLAVEELTGIGILEVLVLDPGVGVVDIAIKQILAVIGIRFQVSLLNLVADELRIARRQLGLDELELAFLDLVRQLLAANGPLQYLHEVDGIGADLRRVVVERRRKYLEGEPGRDPVHAFVHPSRILVFLSAAGLRVGFLQAVAVVDPHLREQRRVFVLAQAGQHRKAGERFEGCGSAGRAGEFGALNELFVDLLLLGDPQAVRHLDDADAVDERLVVLVALEAAPFRFVRVRENHSRERYGSDVLGADIIAFLGGGKQRMQHLDRCLEHLDELEQALVGPVQAARIAVGIGIVLGEALELADIDLADERRDVLIVLVARLVLCNGDLPQPRGLDLRDAKTGNVAAEFLEALEAPWAHEAV